MKLFRFPLGRAVVALALVAASAGLAACSPAATPQQAVQGVEKPAPWNRSTPQNAIRSYLDWTSFAYRMVNSDVATQTMSADEEVRVNSFVELNKENNKIINQRLVAITFGKPSTEATKTLVPTHESWEYSYLALDSLKSVSPTYTASYEVTYTVISPRRGLWVVDSVNAKPLGEVK